MLKLPVRKELFWDIDFGALDEQVHKVHIVQQVLNLGTLQEFRSIMDFYGFDEVREAVKKVGYLDSKTLSFVFWYFNLEKNDLKCCKESRLNHRHWI